MAASDDPRPPARVRGMLGPHTRDEFGAFSGYEPPTCRSRIAGFTVDDARSVLDGDVSSACSRALARNVRSGQTQKVREHGGHRHGTGWGKSEFEQGWGELEVTAFVAAIIDKPVMIVAHPYGFIIRGTHRGVPGEVVVNHDGSGSRGWYVATAYPIRVP